MPRPATATAAVSEESDLKPFDRLVNRVATLKVQLLMPMNDEDALKATYTLAGIVYAMEISTLNTYSETARRDCLMKNFELTPAEWAHYCAIASKV